MFRSRRFLAIALFATISLGLASRRYPGLFPTYLGKYPGDALWAQMFYWAVCFAIPTVSIAGAASCALAIAYVDEISQLYQAPWINQIRATTIGHLALGTAFSWYDILAYTLGVMLTAAVELLLLLLLNRQKISLTESIDPGCES